MFGHNDDCPCTIGGPCENPMSEEVGQTFVAVYGESFDVGGPWIKPEVRLSGVVLEGETYETAYYRVLDRAKKIWFKQAMEQCANIDRRKQLMAEDKEEGLTRWFLEMITGEATTL